MAKRKSAPTRPDAPPTFETQRHAWLYQEGEWKETKVAADRWEFTYTVPKRRAGNAPEGSAPVGTESHWVIVAQQNVRKLDATSYATEMAGLKVRTSGASGRAQRRRLIQVLEQMIDELSRDLEPVEEYRSSRRQHSGSEPARAPQQHVGMVLAKRTMGRAPRGR